VSRRQYRMGENHDKEPVFIPERGELPRSTMMMAKYLKIDRRNSESGSEFDKRVWVTWCKHWHPLRVVAGVPGRHMLI